MSWTNDCDDLCAAYCMQASKTRCYRTVVLSTGFMLLCEKFLMAIAVAVFYDDIYVQVREYNRHRVGRISDGRLWLWTLLTFGLLLCFALLCCVCVTLHQLPVRTYGLRAPLRRAVVVHPPSLRLKGRSNLL